MLYVLYLLLKNRKIMTANQGLFNARRKLKIKNKKVNI